MHIVAGERVFPRASQNTKKALEKMKRLLIALVAAVAVSTGFAKLTYTQGFEGESYNPSSDFEPSVANEDASEIANHGTAPSVTVPYNFSDFGDKYYELDTGNATLWYTNECSAPYFDMVMQFNPSATEPVLDNDTKIAVYVNTNNNLVVISGDGSNGTFTDAYPSFCLSSGTWARLTIAVIEGEGKFAVYLDKQKVGEFLPLTGTATINSIGFKGSGALDDFVARTTDPMYTRTTEVVGIGGETGGEYFTEVSDAAIEASALAKLPLTLYGNAIFTANPAVGASFTIVKGEYELTGLDNDKYAVNGNTYTRVAVWSDYLGKAVAGAYEIDDLDELKKFQENVGQLATVGETFKLTADIALDAPWPGIGLQNGKDVVGQVVYTNGAFRGTFDGQNHTISNYKMAGGNLDYGGFFNSVLGATIRNMKISFANDATQFAADTSSTSTESGATFVGVSQDSTLEYLETIATANTINCGKGVGGIVGYLTDASVVQYCTNNVAFHSYSNKVGGIAMIRQNMRPCTIRGCKNAAMVSTGSGKEEFGAIVGYAAHGLTIEDCENTANVKLLYHNSGDVTISGVNKGHASARSYTGAATPGLNFATVDGDVATFVADDALALNGTYKVMANGATASYAFSAAGTIAFDTALFAPTYNITVAKSNLFDISDATVGSVKTYTVVGGTAVASITKEEVKTDYNTIAKAIDDAENDDMVVLEADSDESFSLPTGVSFALNGHTYGGTVSAAAGNGYVAVEVNGVYAVVDNTSSTWIGGEDGYWNEKSSWSNGCIPSQYTTVTFGSDCRVRIGTGWTSTASVSNMFVNANVIFSDNNINYAYYPSVKTHGDISGTGTLTLQRCGIDGNGGSVSIGCNLAFNNDSTDSVNHDSFLISGTYTIGGDISGSGYLKIDGVSTVNGDIALTGSSYSKVAFQAAATINGDVSLGGAAQLNCNSVPSFGESATLLGSGTIVVAGNNLPAEKMSALLGDSSKWTGTYHIKNMSRGGSSVWWFSQCGNQNSTIRLDGVSTVLKNAAYSDGNHNVKVEIASGGFTVNGNYSHSYNWVFPNKLSGTGTITVNTGNGATPGNKGFVFTGDCSEFSGNIAFASDTANTRLVFGTTDREFKEKTICVGSDAVVGAGATWTASDEIYLDGVVKASANTSLSTVVGSGKIVYGDVPTGTHTFGEGWSGIGALDYKGESRIDLANYVNTIAQKCSCDTVEVVDGCSMQGDNYLNANVTPTLKVSGFVVINDGSSDNKRTISNLTGDGVLVFGTKGKMVNYAVDNVVDWNGVITNSSSYVLITNVVSGTGTIVANVKPAEEPAFGAGWEGVYVANHDIYKTFGTLATAIVPDAYGVSGSTVVIGSALEGTFTKKTESAAPSVAPALYLKANVTINNGFWSTLNRTTFAEVGSDAGVVLTTRNAADNNTTYYTFTKLKDYDGSIVVRNYCKVTIVEIVKDAVPAVGARVLAITCNATGAEIQNLESTKVTVGGVEQDVKLEYLADGKDGAGLYVAAPVVVVEITVPAIEHATATVTTNGVEIATSGAGKYAVEEGATVTITYEAASGYILSGTSQYTIASAEQGSTIEITDTEVAAEIAAVYRNDQKVDGYTSLRAAIAAAQAGDTVNLLADDRVSFSMDNLEVAINKALTIDGHGFTVYGVSDYAGGAGDHDIYISGSGDVTIKNVTLAGFAGAVANNMRTYPIWTGSAYSGTLTLDTVTVQDFNRTAFNLNGGTVVVTNCTITCDNTKATDFQEGIGVYLANVTIVDTTITGAGSLDENWPKAACIQLGNPNGTVPGTGTITVLGGSFAGQYGIIVASNAQNNVSVQGGSFTGSLDVEEGEAGTISLTGGTFDRDVNAFCASGYEAKETSSGSGVWVVSVKTGKPVTPGEDDGKSYDSPEDAAAAAAKVDIGATTAVENAVGAAGLGAYLANFEGKVVDNGDGTYKVVVGLKAAAEAALADDATTNVMATVAASLPDIVADAATEQTEVTVSNVVPGFYYSISYGTSLGAMNTEGARVLAPASGTITLQTPAKAANATAGFYKVNVNVTDK